MNEFEKEMSHKINLWLFKFFTSYKIYQYMPHGNETYTNWSYRKESWKRYMYYHYQITRGINPLG